MPTAKVARTTGIVSWVLFALTIPVSVTLGQTAATGALVGTVTDSSGAVMPEVSVTAVNPATDARRTTKTDGTGVYRIPLLPPATYLVEFQAAGFKTQRRSDVTINVTATYTLDVAMDVGGVTDAVTVQGGANLVQLETTTLGLLFNQLTVQNLPLTNRNYTQILHLSPGVVADVTNAGQLGRNTQDVYANGMRALDNNYQMDGAHVNNFGTGRAGDSLGYTGISIPNPDAIQEFKVQTTLYDAGYGRGVGANVNVVTKSGSNAFHGTAFEFLRNEALNANDFFLNRNAQRKPILRQNQFGGTLGGHLRKDKLFFFTSYQRTLQTNGVGTASLRSTFLPRLTADRSRATLGAQFCGQRGARGGVAVACDGSNINPVAVALLNYKLPNGEFIIPTPQTIQPNGQGFSVFSVPATYIEDQVIVNLDYLLTKKHTLSGRWFSSRNPQVVSFTTSNTPGSGAGSNFANKNLVMKLVSVFNPTFVNEAKVGLLRYPGDLHTLTPVTASEVGITPIADLPKIPGISVSGLFSLGGSFNDDFKTAITSFRVGDEVSWVHGHHSVRAGFELEQIADNFDLYGGKRGSIGFQTFPDFLLGMSAAQNGSAFSNIDNTVGYSGFRDKQFRTQDRFAFIQDDFKIHPRLTLNLGLRWESYGGISEKHGRMTNFWAALALNTFPAQGTLAGFVVGDNWRDPLPDGVVRNTDNTCCKSLSALGNWGPRVGLAWRPLQTNRFVVRSGYGIFYTRTSGNEMLQLTQQPPWVINFRTDALGEALATFQVPFNPAPPPISAFPVWLPRTASSQLTFQLLSPNWVPPMTQQYSFNIQYEPYPSYLLEVGYVGTRGSRLLRTREFNQALLASPEKPVNGITTNTVANATLRVPVLGMAPNGLLYSETYGFVTHNALHMSLLKRLSRGVQFQAAYTYGKTLDDIAASSSSIFGGFMTNDVNNRHQAWGPADFDVRQRLVLNYVWEVPQFHNGKALAGKLLSGWQLSGVTTFQTGRALTILDTRAGSIYGAFSTGLFNMRGEMCPGATYGSIGTDGRVQERLNAYFNKAAFCLPRAIGDGLDYGSAGRGIVRGPDQRNFDFAITKRTPVTERTNVEFRAEAFNLFNHPQFADPAVVNGVSNFGTITGTKVAPRIMQVALKVNF